MHFIVKCIILRRQARDKHGESSKKRVAFPGGGQEDWDDHTDISRLCLDADGTLKTVDDVFRDFDRDRSGQMDFDEYLAAMSRLRVEPTLARELFEAADLPDGELDMEEFQALWVEMRNVLFGTSE